MVTQTRGGSMGFWTVVEYGQQAQLSAAGIPQITVSHGNATAGGAYQVALSDYVILVRGRPNCSSGPPLLKAATGEGRRSRNPGRGRNACHGLSTGEYLAESDEDGIRIARMVVSQLPPDAGRALSPDQDVLLPRYPTSELRGIVSEDKRIPYDMREVIMRIVDDSRFDEFQPVVDQQTLCGHVHVGGWRMGIITNNGPITPQGQRKLLSSSSCAIKVIRRCCSYTTPLAF